MIRRTARALSNRMLVLSEADVRKCLPVPSALAATRTALSSLLAAGDGGAVVPTRIGLPYNSPDGGNTGAADWSLFKPAAYYPPQSSAESDEEVLMGMKLVSVRGNNPAKYNKPTVPATTMLLNAETGEVAAVVAATYLTAARTAAGSALATELSLRRNPKAYDASGDGLTLVVFGAGLQAELHVKCISHLANISHVVIVNRSLERAEKLKDRLLSDDNRRSPDSMTQSLTDISTTLLSDEVGVREAVQSADIIATTTNTSTPLFPGEWLTPGCHINGVGSYTGQMCEVDEAAVRRCEVLIDTKEASDVGDLACLKCEEERPSPNYAGLIGDALADNLDFGKLRDDPGNGYDCTFYKSVGTAIMDVVSTHVAVQNASKDGIGTSVDM